ncbi:hypothetical protein [Sporolactobacillus putidus]|uniref:Uncharacterized protein n=1 Tax=Sporolactobacillus putidus TaxID=492735 RepID=A0A917W1L1_9BACL|nr:hypothetical protein [Sporolactobacillus putidus]GGL51668.1 hypothetical protein GCM10007968_14770 [Sporolactobacillus putidus]
MLPILIVVTHLLMLLPFVHSVSADPSILAQQLGVVWSDLSIQDTNSLIHTLNLISIFFITFSIVSIILAVIALNLLKRGSKYIWAERLLILSSVASLMEIVPGILYIIAGIIVFCRKNGTSIILNDETFYLLIHSFVSF